MALRRRAGISDIARGRTAELDAAQSLARQRARGFNAANYIGPPTPTEQREGLARQVLQAQAYDRQPRRVMRPPSLNAPAIRKAAETIVGVKHELEALRSLAQEQAALLVRADEREARHEERQRFMVKVAVAGVIVGAIGALAAVVTIFA